MQQVVVVFGHLTFHLHHVGTCLFALLKQGLRLAEHSPAVGKFALGQRDALPLVHGLDKLGHHGHGLVVGGFLQGCLAGGTCQPRLLEGMEGASAVKECHLGPDAVVVLEGRDVVVGVGAGVDVASPVVLCRCLRRYRGQEIELCGFLFIPALRCLHALFAHVIAVFDGVGNAVVHRPPLLCEGCQACQCAYDDTNVSFHTPHLRAKTVPQTIYHTLTRTYEKPPKSILSNYWTRLPKYLTRLHTPCLSQTMAGRQMNGKPKDCVRDDNTAVTDEKGASPPHVPGDFQCPLSRRR